MTSSEQSPLVAMVGGGQLARMTHQAAIALGRGLRVVAEHPDDPAAQVSPDVVLGKADDLEALRRAARGAVAVTFDHEHVPQAVLRALEADGVAVHPPSSALRFAQDKLAMRERLVELGAPAPGFWRVVDPEQCPWPDGGVVLKTASGGYDGRGVWFPQSQDEAQEVVAQLLEAGQDVLAEEKVVAKRELSALVARSPLGQVAAWPVVETVQENGMCVVVVAPAQGLPPGLAAAAQELAIKIATELGVVGVLAVELFETEDGRILVNELAMRPHNSGHWTMDGSTTSQFEQHLRAVLDYPLGDPGLTAGVVVMANIVGGVAANGMSMDERVHHLMARSPRVKVHLYGKEPRPGRKIGHVNLLGAAADAPAVRAEAEQAARWLSSGTGLSGGE
ncbi:MAG: 5-(carboxyamino)imidazole ribonucleotide synthase [Segniliparus sp.]|uniref:5-(carboxyamino)imidazole ribonucleotide synthase n=1 Tax=Segniliparus sp. TaxID=2804064 RepID=UPI003F3826C6